MRPSNLPGARSLAGRLLWFSIAQASMCALAAIVIAWLTLPPHPHAPPRRAHHTHHADVDERHRPRPRAPNEGLSSDDLNPRVGPILTLALIGLLICLGGVAIGLWLRAPMLRLTRTSRALAAGDFGARVGLIRDDELGDLARTIDEMAEKIQDTLASEKQLLATISHELRTPLARANVALELLRDESPPAKSGELNWIIEDLAEIEGLLADVFALARLDQSCIAGAVVETAREETSAIELLLGGVEKFQSRHPERFIDIITPREDAQLFVHPIMVRRAIENLIENAHKYTNPDTQITAELIKTAHDVTFRVSDEGEGIPDDIRETLFTPFTRGHAATTRGLGLGLTLVKRVTNAHAGEIAIDSCEGEGTAISLTFEQQVKRQR